MKNTFNHGKKWNGKSSTEGSITYNDVTKKISEWVIELETKKQTLSAKVLKAQKGLISWDEAMANKDQRQAIFIAKRKIRRQKEAAAKKAGDLVVNEKKRMLKAALKNNIDKFIYGSLKTNRVDDYKLSDDWKLEQQLDQGLNV